MRRFCLKLAGHRTKSKLSGADCVISTIGHLAFACLKSMLTIGVSGNRMKRKATAQLFAEESVVELLAERLEEVQSIVGGVDEEAQALNTKLAIVEEMTRLVFSHLQTSNAAAHDETNRNFP
jgi:hypothetical protein